MTSETIDAAKRSRYQNFECCPFGSIHIRHSATNPKVAQISLRSLQETTGKTPTRRMGSGMTRRCGSENSASDGSIAAPTQAEQTSNPSRIQDQSINFL